MRVLLTTDAVGGVWTFTQELTAGLLRLGHFVLLLSLGPEPSGSQRNWIVQVEQRYGSAFLFTASITPLEWMEDNEDAYSAAEGLLLRLIDEFTVHVIHASQFCFGALPVDVPIVVTAHSDVLSWAESCKPNGLTESRWVTTYMRLICAGIAGAAAVVTPTCWMRDALTRHFPTCTEARVIYNGRTLAIHRNGSRTLQAVTLGRVWDEAKGLVVLEALESPIPVLVVGETRFEGGQAPDLKNVTFLGRLEEDETLDVLRNSSLYLATSIYEPFGLAPLEAALCGCAVIARDIASLREVWGGCAEYFGSSSELTEVVSRLLDSPAELKALRRRSMERALEFSAARMVDEYVVLYERLLAMPSAYLKVARCAN